MRRLTRWFRAVRRGGPVPSSTDSTDFGRILQGFEGRWVAILGGEVVEARETPYLLIAKLRERGIQGASIIRAPAVDEPEMVGFG